MKAQELSTKELRLGNLIYWDIPEKENVIHTVVGIRNNTVNTRPISLGNSVEDYKPILLTPELLEKAGFKKTKSSYEEAETYDFYKGIIYLDMANNSMKVNGVYALSFIPEYFHHLQNLIFDLTGEEITI